MFVFWPSSLQNQTTTITCSVIFASAHIYISSPGPPSSSSNISAGVWDFQIFKILHIPRMLFFLASKSSKRNVIRQHVLVFSVLVCCANMNSATVSNFKKICRWRSCLFLSASTQIAVNEDYVLLSAPGYISALGHGFLCSSIDFLLNFSTAEISTTSWEQ